MVESWNMGSDSMSSEEGSESSLECCPAAVILLQSLEAFTACLSFSIYLEITIDILCLLGDSMGDCFLNILFIHHLSFILSVAVFFMALVGTL